MKSMKSTLQTISIFFLLSQIFVIEAVHAAGIDDPFEKATEKVTEGTELLMGKFAVSLCSLIIVIAGIAMWFNKLQKETAMRIIGGAVIIGSAAGIASWLMTA